MSYETISKAAGHTHETNSARRLHRNHSKKGQGMTLGFGFEYMGQPPVPVVTVVEPGSPAECGGVKLGDHILNVDGQDVAGLNVDVRALLMNNNPQVNSTPSSSAWRDCDTSGFTF